MTFTVTVGYDTAGSYYIYSSNILGLYAEAKSFDALVGIIKDAVPSVVHDLGAKVVIAPGIVVCNRTLAKELAW